MERNNTHPEDSSIQESTINLKGKYVAGRDLIVNTFVNFKWAILAAFVITFMAFAWSSKTEINAFVENLQRFSASDTTNLKILLLPFRADQDNLSFNIDYKGQLIRRIEDKKKLEQLAVKLLSLDKLECPATDEEAKMIGIKKNADLVIWGSFVETNLGPKKVRLQYALLKDFELPQEKLSEGNHEGEITDVTKLREGFLQNDLDYVISWIEGISSFKENNYEKALIHFENIYKDSIHIQTYDDEVLENLGNIFYALGRYEKSIIFSQLLLDRINNMPSNYGIVSKITVLTNLGVLYSRLGDHEKSFKYQKQAIDLLDKTEEIGKQLLTLSISLYSNIAIQYQKQFNYPKANEYFKKSIKTADSTYTEHFEMNDTINRLFVRSQINWANMNIETSDYKAALKNLEIAEKKAVNLFEPNHEVYLNLMGNQARVFSELGDYEKALKYQIQLINLEENKLDSLHPDFIYSYNSLAVYFEKSGQLDSSLFYQKKAIDIAQIHFKGDEIQTLAQLYGNYGISFCEVEKHDSAIAYIKNAISILENINPKTNFNLAIAYNHMAYTLREMTNFEKAIFFQKKGTEILEKVIGREHSATGKFYRNHARIYHEWGKNKQAKQWVAKAIAIFSNQFEANHPDFVAIKELEQNINLGLKNS